MLNGLDGKIAVVAGGAGSIGEAVIDRLLEEGCRCACIDASEDKLADLTGRFGRKQLLTICADLTDERSAECSLETVAERFGRIDFLVNAAAILGPDTEVVDLATEQFEKVFSINVRAGFLMMRSMLRSFHATSTRGAIVNFSSIAARRVRGGRSLYAMTKRAVEAMTIAAALENFERGIRVNCVAPGPVESEMYRALVAEKPNAMKGTPVGQPSDVAGVVAFLLSDDASHCTGHTYFVDGGVAA